MTPRDALLVLGWTVTDLATELVIDRRQVSRWVNGIDPMPERLALWLTCLVDEWRAVRARFPVPTRPA